MSPRQSRGVLAGLAVLYLAAALFRLGDPHAPGSVISREFRSAIIARAIYFDLDASVPEWRQQVVRASWQREGRLEPPLTELVVALGYRLAGGERLWISRVVTTAFWLLGGVFLLAIARRVASPGVALLSLGFYLLAPLGVTTSRSFQPDSLMILLLLVALHAMLRHADQPSPRRFAAVVVASAAAVLAKPFIGFMVLAGFASLAVHRKGWRSVMGGELILFVTLTLIPTILWYAWGPLAGSDWYDVGIRAAEGRARPSSRMLEQLLQSLLPNLFLSPGFWSAWLRLVVGMLGPAAILAALIGFALFRRGPVRALVAGLAAAYPLFGLATSARIADHGYYHLQLVPVVALCLAPLGEAIRSRARALDPRWPLLVVVALAVAIWTGLALHRVRRDLARAEPERPELCRRLGELVGHSTRTVYVARYYGRPLEYFGELSGVPWPKAAPGDSAQTVEQRLELLTFRPEYFIVTDLQRLERHHRDLQAWLDDRCSVVSAGDEHLVYGSCETGATDARPVAGGESSEARMRSATSSLPAGVT